MYTGTRYAQYIHIQTYLHTTHIYPLHTHTPINARTHARTHTRARIHIDAILHPHMDVRQSKLSTNIGLHTQQPTHTPTKYQHASCKYQHASCKCTKLNNHRHAQPADKQISQCVRAYPVGVIERAHSRYERRDWFFVLAVTSDSS